MGWPRNSEIINGLEADDSNIEFLIFQIEMVSAPNVKKTMPYKFHSQHPFILSMRPFPIYASPLPSHHLTKFKKIASLKW